MAQLQSEPPIEPQQEGGIPQQPKVVYRLSEEEFRVMQRIADILYKNGSIKVNSVNALAKAAAFAQINIYLQLEAKENAYKERQVELDRRNVKNIRGFDYVPNLGQY